ncbi:MAG: GNAT family N-acetyltransferase [Solirubrobacteraceae bacterium]
MISEVTGPDLPELLVLMRGYCDFYGMSPTDEDLLVMARSLIADHDREGVQLLARGKHAEAIGFATVFWSWSTLGGCRIGVLNDLFVSTGARGTGTGTALIEAARERCRRRSVPVLTWQTALDNHRAQRVYDRLGADRAQWLDYWIAA